MTANQETAVCANCGAMPEQWGGLGCSNNSGECFLYYFGIIPTAIPGRDFELWNRANELLAARDLELERVAFEAGQSDVMSQLEFLPCDVDDVVSLTTFTDWKSSTKAR